MQNNQVPAKMEDFSNLNFGTKPGSVKFEEISVVIDPEFMFRDMAAKYVEETYFQQPLKAKEAQLTEEEMDQYLRGLLAIRVESIHGKCKVWREAKRLYIPTWIQFILSQLGTVVDYDYGLKMVPVYDGKYDINALIATSNKLGAFQDCLSMHKDAFPRGPEGDRNTMSMVVLDGFVQSRSKDAHPIHAYVTAFLGMKLEEDTAFRMLFRVRYDDAEFIKTMLLNERSIR